MFYIILALSFLNLLLGILVFVRTRHEKENIIFLCFAGTVSLWTFNNFYLRLNPDIFFLRLSYSFGILVAIFGLIWIYFFLKEPLSNFIKIIMVPSSLALFILTLFSNHIIKTLYSIEILGYEGELGKLFFVYSFFLGIVIFLLFFKLITKMRREHDAVVKGQILYVLYGVSFFAITSFIVSFLIPIIFNTLRFTILDNFSFSVFLIFMVYAIIKHHLFNIKVIATELLTFAIWIFVLVRMLLADNLQERLVNGGLLIFLIISGILLIRSVLKEVRAREEIERLAKELEKTNWDEAMVGLG